ncbi:hypothetical protein CLAIMM_05345 [Cladophialophora immunda]|nr:hypothetical protein CLAIMM_05345 [Cladophialophora immunda]
MGQTLQIGKSTDQDRLPLSLSDPVSPHIWCFKSANKIAGSTAGACAEQEIVKWPGSLDLMSHIHGRGDLTDPGLSSHPAAAVKVGYKQASSDCLCE